MKPLLIFLVILITGCSKITKDTVEQNEYRLDISIKDNNEQSQIKTGESLIYWIRHYENGVQEIHSIHQYPTFDVPDSTHNQSFSFKIDKGIKVQLKVIIVTRLSNGEIDVNDDIKVDLYKNGTLWMVMDNEGIGTGTIQMFVWMN